MVYTKTLSNVYALRSRSAWRGYTGGPLVRWPAPPWGSQVSCAQVMFATVMHSAAVHDARAACPPRPRGTATSALPPKS